MGACVEWEMACGMLDAPVDTTGLADNRVALEDNGEEHPEDEIYNDKHEGNIEGIGHRRVRSRHGCGGPGKPKPQLQAPQKTLPLYERRDAPARS